MKTIGLLGGMSWESTATYYRIINQEMKRRLGGLHSAKILLYSVDFQEIESLQHQGRWDETADILSRAAQRIETAGADLLLICTNTMHKVAPEIQSRVQIPLLHIADATAGRIQAEGYQRLALLGTRFTMEQEFYKGRLEDRFGLKVMVPDSDDRERIHRVIYDELCLGEIKTASRRSYAAIIRKMEAAGAEAVILGCTEIALLVGPEDTDLPLFDTTRIHALAAVDAALSQGHGVGMH